MPTLASAPPTERRIASRRRPTLGTVCHLDAIRTDEPELGLVWNISSTGISILLCEPPKAGASMAGTLLTLDGEHSMAIRLKVIHVKKLETGDYLIGGQFEQAFSPDEMRPFVA